MNTNLAGTVIDGRYVVLSRIARGGMATVYLAHDRRLDRDVAVKVMHPHLAESEPFILRFRREARAAARLSHPNAVAVFDQGTWGDSLYLTMEYVEGEDLRDTLRRVGALSVGEALEIIKNVLDALAAAHRRDLIHRDIKPENVLRSTDGTPKLADFGLARAVSDATQASTGTVLGTVAYLAPELVTEGAATRASDVYAVGVMLFELLTGRQPFFGDIPINVAFQHVTSSVPPVSTIVPGIPREVDDLVAALTAHDVPDRLPDGEHALAKVRRVLEVLSPESAAIRADVSGVTDASDPT
ncbi:MAG: protein kinase, partial [Ruaniaceae bacterium]|nr:protein kinase [Ruaniaceae bacterium]